MEEINLEIDRLVITGLDVSPSEAERFHRLLEMELQRLLLEEYGVRGVDLESELIRLDYPDIDLREDGGLTDIVSEVARRIVLNVSQVSAELRE